MSKGNSLVINLMGPTAIGKTALSLELAEIFPIEIISVDSAMIYRGMDIGTGKPTPEILTKIPHHLINIIDPDEYYSVAKFCESTHKLIKSIHQRQKIPLLVGGTMMYFKSLRYGYAELPNTNLKIREQIQQETIEKGLKAMHEQLEKIDPTAAARIHPNDPQRTLRALEVFYSAGKTLTELLQQQTEQPTDYRWLEVALLPNNRKELHTTIANRFDAMLKDGFINEVKTILRNYTVTENSSALRSVGYRQIYQFLQHQIDEEQMREQAISATRQLAKRQLTWLRSWPNLHTFSDDYVKNLENIKKVIGLALT